VTPIDLPRASNSATPRGVAQLAPQLEYDLRGASASPPHGRLVLETPNDDAVLEIELVPPPAVGTAPSTPSSRWFPTPALSIGIVHGTPPAESHRTIEARAWRDVDGLYRFRVDPSVTRITVSTTPQFGEMAPFEPQRGRLHRLRLVGDRLESR
jgi:hypothetical protein